MKKQAKASLQSQISHWVRPEIRSWRRMATRAAARRVPCAAAPDLIDAHQGLPLRWYVRPARRRVWWCRGPLRRLLIAAAEFQTPAKPPAKPSAAPAAGRKVAEAERIAVGRHPGTYRSRRSRGAVRRPSPSCVTVQVETDKWNILLRVGKVVRGAVRASALSLHESLSARGTCSWLLCVTK
jgi:hypothetical protein